MRGLPYALVTFQDACAFLESRFGDVHSASLTAIIDELLHGKGSPQPDQVKAMTRRLASFLQGYDLLAVPIAALYDYDPSQEGV